eukprot:GFUD01041576.1.p1 GENE.GFUD01041576.1~~GFUD01041576.1.p1  ORF type:complete len:140 (+),score=35.08 GFUD01041576.1:148-567(+)
MVLIPLLLITMLAPLFPCERLVLKGSLKECKGKDEGRICDGAVIKELKTINAKNPPLQVCEKGKLKVKGQKKVGADAPKQGGECEWYGQLYCNGDIIVDLYSWKFLKKCGQGRMYIYGRSWQEVADDTRFQDFLGNLIR